MGYKIAVVGATGNVGREMLNTLAERKFPADEIFALASSKSIGRTVGYGEDDEISVLDAATFDFSKADIALFSAGVSNGVPDLITESFNWLRRMNPVR